LASKEVGLFVNREAAFVDKGVMCFSEPHSRERLQRMDVHHTFLLVPLVCW